METAQGQPNETNERMEELETALHQIQMIAGQLIRSGAEISEDNMFSIFNIEAIARTAGEDTDNNDTSQPLASGKGWTVANV